MKLKAYTDESEENATEVDALYLDGYGFGDRLLEGVPFKITVENGELKASCLDKYQKGIQWKYWEEVCVQHALQDDCFSTTADLDNDDGFIEFAEGEPPNE